MWNHLPLSLQCCSYFCTIPRCNSILFSFLRSCESIFRHTAFFKFMFLEGKNPGKSYPDILLVSFPLWGFNEVIIHITVLGSKQAINTWYCYCGKVTESRSWGKFHHERKNAYGTEWKGENEGGQRLKWPVVGLSTRVKNVDLWGGHSEPLRIYEEG